MRKRPAAFAALLALAGCDGYAPLAIGSLSEQLCDPGSAVVRNVHPSPEFTTGEINARTASGGFAGYVPFVVDNRTHEGRVGAISWPAICENGGNSLEADLALANQYGDNAK